MKVGFPSSHAVTEEEEGLKRLNYDLTQFEPLYRFVHRFLPRRSRTKPVLSFDDGKECVYVMVAPTADRFKSGGRSGSLLDELKVRAEIVVAQPSQYIVQYNTVHS